MGSYFSRLTDIVTCNLTQLLAEAEDPRAAIEQIVREMEEGLAGARRSVANATGSEDRLYQEIHEHRQRVGEWSDKAKQHLLEHREADARTCLIRKREIEDLIAGLQQQHHAAVATREHLATMQRALEARLAEALRKRAALRDEVAHEDHAAATHGSLLPTADPRMTEIDAELEALKRELTPRAMS